MFDGDTCVKNDGVAVIPNAIVRGPAERKGGRDNEGNGTRR